MAMKQNSRMILLQTYTAVISNRATGKHKRAIKWYFVEKYCFVKIVICSLMMLRYLLRLQPYCVSEKRKVMNVKTKLLYIRQVEL